MKYKPGTLCVVTSVPERAASVGVCAGMPALVQEIPDPRERKAAEDAGLTIVTIGFFSFWWREDDLGLRN
jgi:hypothetical protein